MIAAYYGRSPHLSYWEGCSTGGRQGLMSAQRYPEDFDGIIAGAPAYNQIYISAWRMRLLMTALKSPQHALPPEKLKLLNDAVLDKCDGNDGVKGRLIEDPRGCYFDPGALKCSGPETTSCLTPQQLETVNAAYTDLLKSTGEPLYPHLPFGGELGWHLPDDATAPGAIDIDIFRYIANQNAIWDWLNFDLEKDIDWALLRGKEIHAVNPDLAKFKARYLSRLERRRFRRLDLRLEYRLLLRVRPETHGPEPARLVSSFSGPRDGTLRGGTGPNQFNKLAALERWREQNEPPRSITASRVNESGVIDMTRPPLPIPAASCL